jgi:L-asparagine transporter-like permease
MSEPQSFQNHARIVPAYHYFVLPVLTLNLGWSIKVFADTWSFTGAVSVLTASALIVLAFVARVFALTVQDRVIRLEMRQRLRELLPSGLHGRIHEFTRHQLVALRFASDEELAALAEKVLVDQIQDRKAIKQMIAKWHADHLRA